jgi:hypothetical protein
LRRSADPTPHIGLGAGVAKGAAKLRVALGNRAADGQDVDAAQKARKVDAFYGQARML